MVTVTSNSLSGRRIVVTGAASGLGQAAATALRAAGARVFGVDVNPGEDIAHADITDPSQVAAVIDAAVRRLGGIDHLINNAGVGWAQSSGRVPDTDARRMVEVNLFGAWNCTSVALPHLLASHGHVLNVASGIAVLAMPFGAAYSCSKRALTAYSDVLRLEYRGKLHVTTLYPGYLATGIHDHNVAQGYSVAEAVPPDDLAGAARAVVRACRRRPRNAYTSAMTAAAMRLGRVLPQPLELGLRSRQLRAMRSRATPAFLRDDPEWSP